jgi:hypothetical protein
MSAPELTGCSVLGLEFPFCEIKRYGGFNVPKSTGIQIVHLHQLRQVGACFIRRVLISTVTPSTGFPLILLTPAL